MTQLADFIEAHKDEIIDRWQKYAVERLSLDLEKSQLLNDLPEFIDEIVGVLRRGGERWEPVESAKGHGRQRMQVGVDVGSLTEEMTMVGETIGELANEQGKEFSSNELLGMTSVIGRGAAASVTAYAKLRDKELADQAAQHFSFIAHEIRNPLHTARLAAQVLGAPPLPDGSSHLERLDRALRQLSDLVDNALVEARLFGEPRLRLQRVDARELVDEVCDDLAAQIAERRLRVEPSVDRFTLEVDRTLMSSVLSNLLTNAVKFTREDGRIVIRGGLSNERVVFEVHDECGGIPEDFVPQLFEPFSQAASRGRGSGLGLLIVKQAVEAHGGAVSVCNTPGDGCVFKVTLPQSQTSNA